MTQAEAPVATKKPPVGTKWGAEDRLRDAAALYLATLANDLFSPNVQDAALRLVDSAKSFEKFVEEYPDAYTTAAAE